MMKYHYTVSYDMIRYDTIRYDIISYLIQMISDHIISYHIVSYHILHTFGITFEGNIIPTVGIISYQVPRRYLYEGTFYQVTG